MNFQVDISYTLICGLWLIAVFVVQMRFRDLDFWIQGTRISLDMNFEVDISYTFHEMICGLRLIVGTLAVQMRFRDLDFWIQRLRISLHMNFQVDISSTFREMNS